MPSAEMGGPPQAGRRSLHEHFDLPKIGTTRPNRPPSPKCLIWPSGPARHALQSASNCSSWAKADDDARYLAQWQAEMRVMGKSARWHTSIPSLVRILDYCEAASLFDGNEPFCAIVTASGQYDSDDARAIYARRRPEEWIGGRPSVILLRILVQANETDGTDCHVMVRRRHVNAAALKAHAISSMLGRKWAGTGKDGRKSARKLRVDVKHDEERGLQPGRQDRDNTLKGLDASPRGSNDYNVSREGPQPCRRAFSIAGLDVDHPIPLLATHRG
jgi:hypothetical protein